MTSDGGLVIGGPIKVTADDAVFVGVATIGNVRFHDVNPGLLFQGKVNPVQGHDFLFDVVLPVQVFHVVETNLDSAVTPNLLVKGSRIFNAIADVEYVLETSHQAGIKIT